MSRSQPAYEQQAQLVDLVNRMVVAFGTGLSAAAVVALLDPAHSSLALLRHSDQPQLLTAVMAVYRAVLDIKSISVLEAMYALLRRELDQLRPSLAQPAVAAVAQFDLLALLPLVEAPGEAASLRVSVLKPSLVSTLVDVGLAAAASGTEHVGLAVLQVLRPHARRNNFFAAADGAELPAVLALVDAMLPDHLTRVASLAWLREVLEHVASSAPAALQHPACMALLRRCASEVAHHEHGDTRLAALQVLATVVVARQPALLSSQEVLSACLARLDDVDLRVRRQAFDVLGALPASALAHTAGDVGSLGSEVWHGLCTLASQPAFRSHHFEAMVTVILRQLQEPQPAPQPVDLSVLLPRFAHACQLKSVLTKADPDLADMFVAITTRTDLVRLWALYECARFCVHARLRTPLGRPGPTFETIERALRAPATSVQVDNCAAPSPAAARWRQVGVSRGIEFMALLERQLFNAYEGSVSYPAVPKSCRLFFRANRKVCVEWLSRVKIPLLIIASAGGKLDAAISNGVERLAELMITLKNAPVQVCSRPLVSLLNHSSPHVDFATQDMPKHASQFERTMLLVAQALVDLHRPNMLSGLTIWCRNNVPRRIAPLGSHWLPWLDGAVHAAQVCPEEKKKKKIEEEKKKQERKK